MTPAHGTGPIGEARTRVNRMAEDRHVVDLQVTVPRHEVLRAFGCPADAAVPDAVDALIDRYLREAHTWLQPRGVYVVRPIASLSPKRLQVAGGPTFHGQVGQFLHMSQRVVAFVVTIGPMLEEQTRRLLDEHDTLAGLTVDAIGSAAADLAAEALAHHVREHHAAPDEEITPCYSPGYCGMDLQQQEPLFELVRPEVIGVRLLPTMMMQPIKSVSGLIGIGPAEAVTAYGTPCRWCQLANCWMRREEPAKASGQG